jgi:hypothetical protein
LDEKTATALIELDDSTLQELEDHGKRSFRGEFAFGSSQSCISNEVAISDS